LLLLLAVLWLWVAFRYIGSAGCDDAHISYWSSYALAELGQLVNYNGAPVEQSSSLTWVLLLALTYKLLPGSLPTQGYVLGLLAGLLAIVQTYRLAERILRRSGLGAAALTATSWCLLYWSTSGMETALAALLGPTLVLALVDLFERPDRRRTAWLAFVAAAFVACRPENVLIAPCLAAALGVHLGARSDGALGDRVGGRAGVTALAVLVAAPLMLTAWRMLYSGTLVPNAALMKTERSALEVGLEYLFNSAVDTNGLLIPTTVLGLLAALRVVRRSSSEALPLLAAAALGFAELAFVAASGGDWMEWGRFLAPAIPMVAVLTTAALGMLLQRGRAVRRMALLIALGGVLSMTLQVRKRWHHLIPIRTALGVDSRLAEERGGMDFSIAEFAGTPHMRDTMMVPVMLDILAKIEPTADEPVYIASGQGGMIPFHVFKQYFGRAHFLDLFSLTSPELARCLRGSINSRDAYGTAIRLDRVLDAEQMKQDCGLPQPTIFFSNRLRKHMSRLFRERGYVVLYHHQGMLYGNRQGYNLEAFIAVERSVATRHGLTPKRWDFKEDPIGRP
jgi:hypothetical protein